MVAVLWALEKAGLCHGDLCPRGLLLTDAGQIVLVQPGLRGIVRLEEEVGQADLCSEAYDYLAPERVADRSPPRRPPGLRLWLPVVASSGRPATARRGSSLAKVQAARAGRLGSLRELVYDVPGPLAEAIADLRFPRPGRAAQALCPACLAARRRITEGRSALKRCLGGQETIAGTFDPFSRNAGPSRQRGIWPVLTAGLLTLMAAGIGLAWLAASLVRPGPEPGAIAAGSASPLQQETIDRPHWRSPRRMSPPQRTKARSSRSAQRRLNRCPASQFDWRPGRRFRPPRESVSRSPCPATARSIGVEDVSFENVDFLWQAPGPRADTTAQAAIIRLQAGRAEFPGVCVLCHRQQVGQAGCVVEDQGVKRADALLALPSGRLRLTDCVFHDLAAVVDCRARGAVALELLPTACNWREGPWSACADVPGQRSRCGSHWCGARCGQGARCWSADTKRSLPRRGPWSSRPTRVPCFRGPAWP